LKEYLNQGLVYMVQLSKCEDNELFQICLDFWQFFTVHVNESNNKSTHYACLASILAASGAYENILSGLRQILMRRMMKPLELLISIDAGGELTDDEEENRKQVDLHETIKKVLINVTNIDPSAMYLALKVRFGKLMKQKKENFSYD